MNKGDNIMKKKTTKTANKTTPKKQPKTTKKPKQVKASGSTTSIDGVVVVHPVEETVKTAIEQPILVSPPPPKDE